jgi:SAM-dependent methyltransferase
MNAVLGDGALQDAVLEDLVEAVHYRRWLVDLCAPHLGDDPLEVGSGLGHYAADWAVGRARFTASEADPARLEALRARFAADPVVRVRELAVPVRATGEHSAVVACNVLEHVPDDVGALRDLRPLLRAGGRLVLVVPACPAAMSGFDRAIGHQRRYTAAGLRAVVEAAGYRVELLHHVNAVGLLGWLVLVKALGRRPQAGALLRLYDGGVVPWLRRVEARRRPPFGQSLLVVGRLPT